MKRRRTDESEKPVGQASSSGSFSSEASGDDSSDDDKKGKHNKSGKEARAKGKAKGKAKASADDKAKTRIKTVAKAASRKILPALASLRIAIANPLLLDVEDTLVDRVRALIHALTALEKAAHKASTDGIDGFTSDFDTFDFKGCKDVEKELKKQLAKLEKKRR